MLRSGSALLVALVLCACGGANVGDDRGFSFGDTTINVDYGAPGDPGVEGDRGPVDDEGEQPFDPGPWPFIDKGPGPDDPGPLPQDPGTTPYDPGPQPEDPGVGPKDPGSAWDPGPDTGIGGCDPCGYGSVAGLTCAPNSKTAIPYVKIWVDTVDCDGNPIHVETHSDAKGNYTLNGVPCGQQLIKMQKGSFQFATSRYIEKGKMIVLTPQDSCFEGTAARIAVVTGKWDQIDKLLVQLWFHFSKFDGLMEEGSTSMPEGAKLLAGQEAKNTLGQKKKLRDDFDIVFINCGNSPDMILSSWGPDVLQTLRQFVAEGGSVYMSDWASVYMTQAWPAAWSGSLIRDFGGGVGTTLKVTSNLKDPDLASYLNKPTAVIEFGLSPLTSITGSPAGDTMVHIEGPNKSHGNAVEAFMFSFSPNGEMGGRVVYTNFHNDEQPTAGDMTSILQYAVFLM